MDYAHSATDKMLMALEGKIRNEYGKAAKEVEASMKKYLSQFAEQDAKRLKMLDAGDITKKEYIAWRSEQMIIGDKWIAMRNELTSVYMNADKVARKLIRDETYKAYALNHNFGTFEAEMGAGLSTNYTLYNRDTVARLVKDNPKLLPPIGKRTSEKIRSKELKRWNQQQIQSVMMQGVLQGKSIPDIAKNLAKSVSEKNNYAHIRTARTMTTAAENVGRLDSYRRAEDMGIVMEKQWVATIDDRTRDSHSDMDGESVPFDEEFSNGLMYPADPNGDPEEVYNCRCTLVGDVMSVNGASLEAIDTELSFEEWMEEHQEE